MEFILILLSSALIFGLGYIAGILLEILIEKIVG